MSDAAAEPDQQGLLAQRGGGGSGHPSIVVQGRVLERIEAETSADRGTEAGGLLIGNAAPATNFVLVTGSIAAPQPAPDASRTDDSRSDGGGTEPAEFTLTPAALEGLAGEVASSYPGQRIVGWYRGNSSAGVYLSAADLDLQRTSFAKAWQVVYVHDPVRDQGGFFGWSGRAIVRVPDWEVTSVAHAPDASLAVEAPAVAGPADDPVAHDALEPADEGAVGPAIYPSGEWEGSSTGIGEADPAFGPPSTVVIDVDQPTPFGAGSPAPPTKRKRRLGAVIAAIAAVGAIVIAVIVLNSDDDENASTDSGGADSSVAESVGTTVTTGSGLDSVVIVASTPESAVDTTEAVGTATTTVPTGATTSTTAGGTSTPGATEISFPPAPATVQPPAGRVGPSAVACEETAAGTYEPLADCFVPLNNGNILVFASGSLRCTDPAGQVLAAEAQAFTVGDDDDPLALVADDALIATCIDLTYAKNVLADGAEVLDGLCGSSGTQINDATRRCLGHNLTTGSIVAVVRSTESTDELAALCTSVDGRESTTPLTWSQSDVGPLWLIERVLFDAEQGQFTATASRDGATATATIDCE